MSSSDIPDPPSEVKEKKSSSSKRKERKDRKKKEKRKHDATCGSSIATEEVHGNDQSNKREKLAQTATQQISKCAGNDDGGSFQDKRVRILVSVPPSSLVNISDAMNTSMQNLLLKYSNGLGGVLIAYHDVELDDATKDGARGKIINEMPHIHYYIKCNVLIFNPSAGTELKGKVNESSEPSHIGLLVHELFNASISAESLRENGFDFDHETNEWKMKEEEDEGRVIRVGDGMKFIIDRFHECNGMISLECSDPRFMNLSA